MSGGREGASWPSVVFFTWITPLVKLAYGEPLELKHLFPLPSRSKTAVLTSRFEEAWRAELRKTKGERR